MPSSLNILITGAAGGLGRGLSLSLATKGHYLLLADENADALRETAVEIAKTGASASTHRFDVRSSDEIQTFVQSLASARIDVLINNAGLQHVSPLGNFPEEKWDLLLDVMLKGPFLLTKALLPQMRSQDFGRIVNIGSIHSLVASPFKSAYVAAKHGLLGLSKVVALETGDADITVNTICPGYLRTPLVEAQIKSQAKAYGMSEDDVIHKVFLEPMPKKAFITIDEVAAAVSFLISHEARNITGQTIVIDGGWTAR